MVRNVILIFDVFFFKFDFTVLYTDSPVLSCLENHKGVDDPLIVCSEDATNAFVVITFYPHSAGNNGPFSFTGYDFHST